MLVAADDVSVPVPAEPAVMNLVDKMFEPGVLVLRVGQADAYAVLCDVHPEMEAFVGVVLTRYFAVTGPDGEFRIPGVPVGPAGIVTFKDAWLWRLPPLAGHRIAAR